MPNLGRNLLLLTRFTANRESCRQAAKAPQTQNQTVLLSQLIIKTAMRRAWRAQLQTGIMRPSSSDTLRRSLSIFASALVYF